METWIDAWLDVTLDGTVRGIHVRWLEDGQLLKHDETWDDELTLEEAQALIDFVLATS